MDQLFTCTQGHRWRPTAGAGPANTCPVCGGAALPPGVKPGNDDPATTRHTLVPGYQILGQAGVGDVAIVFRARDVKNDRIVAVKILRGDDQGAPTASRRFQREIHCLAELKHPNIVTAYEAGTADGLPFLVMEYLEGGSLAKKVSGSPMPPREAAALMETVARTIQYVHERGFVHRNLKPHDILFTADGVPKLIDFGLTLTIGPDRQPSGEEGSVIGTPSYMAPEQAAGRLNALGLATDVYGLGAVLYECLTGRPPFQGPTVMETLQRVGAWEPVPPRSLNRQADREIEGVCLRCLRKAPKDRYPSAAAVADDLHRYLEGRPVEGRKSQSWLRLFRRT